MLMSNSSSSSMTSSTVSSESAPRSFTNEVSGVIFSLSTPSCSATISITRSATDATFTILQEGICGLYQVQSERTYQPEAQARDVVLSTDLLTHAAARSL